MLWTYWDATGYKIKWGEESDNDLKELYAIRNCLVHHDGRVSGFIQYCLSNEKRYSKNFRESILLGHTKGYIKYNDYLFFTRDHLIEFTNMVVKKFIDRSGVPFSV